MTAVTHRTAFAGRPRRSTLWWAVIPTAAIVAAFVWNVALPAVILGTVAFVWAIDNRRTARPMSDVRRNRST